MTLVDFLRAQLDEDEQDARAAHEGDGYREWDIPSTGVVQVAGGDMEGLVLAPRNSAIHIARHDPARVLAEVDTKRRIIERHQRTSADHWDPGVCEGCGWTGDPDMPRTRDDEECPELLDLARPYADHPDYNPEWAA